HPYVEVLEGEHEEFTYTGYKQGIWNPKGINVYSKEETDSIITNSGIANRIYNLNDDFMITTGNATYVLHHRLDKSKSLDNYLIDEGTINGTTFFKGTDIEGPIKEVGADDFIGGIHGYESVNSVKVIIDGMLLNWGSEIDKNF